jgi:serine O-acetyltransferase
MCRCCPEVGESEFFCGENIQFLRREVIRREVMTTLKENSDNPRLLSDADLAAVIELAEGDITAFARRDPAAAGCWRYVWRSYGGLRAVVKYRVAHAVYTNGIDAPSDRHRLIARQISERTKAETGVEIHPAARIGRRFIVDHGIGTVIGETVTIGDDCYVLQGVVLGATGIAGNASGRRHPKIGNRVQIGGFARIFGPLVIGDDVLIAAGAVVTADVPGPARVIVNTQIQVSTPHSHARIFGVVPIGGGVLEIHGTGLLGVVPHLVDDSHRLAPGNPLTVITESERLLRCQIDGQVAAARLRLREPAGGEIVLGNLSRVWAELWATDHDVATAGH